MAACDPVDIFCAIVNLLPIDPPLVPSASVGFFELLVVRASGISLVFRESQVVGRSLPFSQQAFAQTV